MSLVLPPIEAYPVQHLPIVKASADRMGWVEVIKQLVSTEMAIDPGTIVLGMLLETWSGRSPLYRLEECLTHQATALLWGKPVTPRAFAEDTVGRVLDRLYDTGTRKVFTACAVRADQIFHFDQRDVHFETTSVTVSGDYLPPEESAEQKRPLRSTDGDSQDKRPALQPLVFATLGVDRAVPIWGQPEEGKASDKTVNHTLVSTIATFLAKPGVAPGASIDVAAAALVTEANLAARGETLCSSRLPATDHECGRRIAEAVAHNTWEESGVLAHTKPTTHRPAASDKADEGTVTRAGLLDRAVVVHARAQDKRRQPRLARDIQASYSTAQTAGRSAEPQVYCCRADAEAAAAKLPTVPVTDHQVDVTVEEQPV